VSTAPVEIDGHAYFGQDEADQDPPRRLGRQTHRRRGFTLYGHRLASLYRTPIKPAPGLMFGKNDPHSSCQKYANPTPATRAPMKGISE